MLCVFAWGGGEEGVEDFEIYCLSAVHPPITCLPWNMSAFITILLNELLTGLKQ